MEAHQQSRSALSVFVRVRPLAQTERHRGAFECVRVVDGQSLLLVDPEKFSANSLRQNRTHEREFRFEAVLTPTTDEEEVHSLVGTEGLVDGLVRFGRNGTVLAYGPTGTGKTYTMVGSRERPGLMTRMTRALYDQLAKNGDRQTRVYISFMEIYNEIIRDLLSTERNGPLELLEVRFWERGKQPLDIVSSIPNSLEDERGNVHIPGLSRVRASNTSRLLQLLQGGNPRRTTEPTAANSTSSRPYALLMITLWRDNTERGTLFMIDLTGSERATNTQNQGQRLKEGAAINRSLLALGNVINSLSNVSDGRRPAYVNYRDSKLTRLLKDSLGGGTGDSGGGRTVLIAHITPSSTSYNETFNTLTYASRAKGITYRLSQPQRRTASADRLYSDASLPQFARGETADYRCNRIPCAYITTDQGRDNRPGVSPGLVVVRVGKKTGSVGPKSPYATSVMKCTLSLGTQLAVAQMASDLVQTDAIDLFRRSVYKIIVKKNNSINAPEFEIRGAFDALSTAMLFRCYNRARATYELQEQHDDFFTTNNIYLQYDGICYDYAGGSCGFTAYLGILSLACDRLLPSHIISTGLILDNGGIGKISGLQKKIKWSTCKLLFPCAHSK